MYDICVQIAGRIDVAKQHGECLGGAVLLGAHIGGPKAIATRNCGAHVDRVRYLKVIAQTLVQHDLRALEGNSLDICNARWKR